MPKIQLTRVSIVCLFLAIGFLMGVFIALLCGAELPCGAARNVFIMLVGFLLAGMWAFLGGKAEADGQMPLVPSLKFKLSGGIVFFIVGCVMAWVVYRCGLDTFLQIIEAKEFPGSTDRRSLEVRYRAVNMPPESVLVLEIAPGGKWDEAEKEHGLTAGSDQKIVTSFGGKIDSPLQVRLTVQPGPDHHQPAPSAAVTVRKTPAP